SFTVKMLTGTRKLARIGDLTHWSASDCTTQGKWSPVTKIGDAQFSRIGVGTSDDVYALSPMQPQKLFHYDKSTGAFVTLSPTFNEAAQDIQELGVGRDGTVGMILADKNVLVYRPTAPNPYVLLPQGSVQFDAGNGGRQLNHIAVFDTNTFALTNHEDISWTTTGFT